MKTIRRSLVVILAALVCLAAVGSQPSRAQAANHAGIVVQLGDGSVTTACVSFDSDQITGYDLLLGSGLSVEASFDAMGAAVCSINGTGCSVDDCFCNFPPDYWSYWQSSGGSWTYSNLGASSSSVTNGEVEGWSWGGGNPPSVSPSFEEICSNALTLPTATQEVILLPTQTYTAIPPTNTSEPIPTSTPEPTQTIAFTATPVIVLPTATTAITPTNTLASTATSAPTPTSFAVAELASQVEITATPPATIDETTLATLPPTSTLAISPSISATETELLPGEQTQPAAGAETGQPGSRSNNLLGISGFLILAGGLLGLIAFRMVSRR